MNLNMNKYLTVLFVLLTLFLVSCEEESSEIEKYEMNYKVILNGDNNISKISVETRTYFPKENITEIIGKGKNKFVYPSDDNYLNDYDSIFIQTDSEVYSGCWKSMFIRFWFFEKEGITTYRDYSFGYDTISTGIDCKVIMSWPEDSAKFEYYEHSY
jgi:hypothetical protein